MNGFRGEYLLSYPHEKHVEYFWSCAHCHKEGHGIYFKVTKLGFSSRWLGTLPACSEDCAKALVG